MSEVRRLLVGWMVDAPFGDFLFNQPFPKRQDRSSALSRRAVQACPAVNDLERRLFVVSCPFDIQLSVERLADGSFALSYDEARTKIDPDIVSRFLTFMPQNLWRRNDRPVIQILLPYVFVSDQRCYLTQLPPFLDDDAYSWPGQLVSGRFEITNWPRILNFAFEFTNLEKDLTLRRGRPLCYFLFEGEDPGATVELCRVKNSDALREFRKGIDGMPKFTTNTFSVMLEAERRRPRKLVIPADEEGDD